MAGAGSDLQSPKKRKREHAEGKIKPRPQVKGGGDGAKRKKHPGAGGYAAHGGAGEAPAKKRPVTPKEKRLAAKVSLSAHRAVGARASIEAVTFVFELKLDGLELYQEMSEARKMKRKRHYSLEKVL